MLKLKKSINLNKYRFYRGTVQETDGTVANVNIVDIDVIIDIVAEEINAWAGGFK